MLKRIFTNSLIYSLGPQIPRIAGLFILPLITPYLTATDYGVQGLITSYTGILGALADLGFAVIMVNSYYAYPNRWRIIWKQLHGFLIGWSFAFCLLQALVILLVFPANAGEGKWWVIFFVCLPVVLFNTTILIGSRFYQYSQRPLYASIVNALVGTITIVVTYVTIVKFKLGYLGWFASSFVGSMVMFFFYLGPVYFKYNLGPIFSFRKRFLKRHLKVSLPTIPHDYSAYLVNSSDRAVFGILKVPITEQGRYNLAYIFGNYFEFFGNAVGMAIGPFYTKLYSTKTHKGYLEARNLTLLMQCLFLGIAVVMSIWAKEIMNLLIRNDELKDAYPLAIIIIMGYVYRPMYWATGIRLSVMEKTNQLWQISFVAGVLNLVLNFIFVPIFGVAAAAVTTFFALLYMGFAGFYVTGVLRSMRRDFQPMLWIALILLSTVGVYLMRDHSVAIKLMVTVVLGCAMLFLLLMYQKEKLFFRPQDEIS